MFILDTDHLTILQQESQPACDRFFARLAEHSDQTLAVTIISFQEQIQGWMAFLNQARSPTKVLLAYQKLQEVLEYFSKSEVLAFDRSAQNQFEAFRRSDVRIGTMDFRIAAIAFTNNCTLLSGNLRDFRRVPGLTVQDWIHQ
jgi:tRNA(fMet)-specific endonuclease VapC